MFTIVRYPGVNINQRAIYCVSPANTLWDIQHLTATVKSTAIETPVILRDGLQVKPIPAWLSWLFHPSAFTVPGTIYIGTPVIPAELLVHEHVHDYQAQRGALRYWGSVFTGLCVGAWRAFRYGGSIHQWSPIEVEARAMANLICAVYVGAPTPIDAAAEVARRLA